MGQGISEVLPFAVGIAISPVPIIAIILILFSDRARAAGPAFLLGWVIGLDAGDAVVALAVFVVVASLSILFAVVYEFAGGERARKTLDEMKAWLTEHNAAVMAVLYLVFGTVLIAKGIGLLSA
jgi:hypothetical protein